MLDLSLGSGILIGVPLPGEEAGAHEKFERAIQQALQEARFLSLSYMYIRFELSQ